MTAYRKFQKWNTGTGHDYFRFADSLKKKKNNNNNNNNNNNTDRPTLDFFDM